MRRGAALLLTVLAGVALADTYIPGTSASYSRSEDPITHKNTSNVFLDELSGGANPTYVQFACNGGYPTFFLNAGDPLILQDEYNEGVTPDLSYQVDTQAPRTAKTAGATLNRQPNLNGLAVQDTFDALLLGAFQSAQNQVVLRVQRTALPDVRYTFPVRGFKEALKAVGNCK